MCYCWNSQSTVQGRSSHLGYLDSYLLCHLGGDSDSCGSFGKEFCNYCWIGNCVWCCYRAVYLLLLGGIFVLPRASGWPSFPSSCCVSTAWLCRSTARWIWTTWLCSSTARWIWTNHHDRNYKGASTIHLKRQDERSNYDMWALLV